jgi:transcriptional regulator of acetoin/glycerol metabolism
MEALERDATVRSVQDNSGDKQEAARALGMSRATVYRKINDYDIAQHRYAPRPKSTG